MGRKLCMLSPDVTQYWWRPLDDIKSYFISDCSTLSLKQLFPHLHSLVLQLCDYILLFSRSDCDFIQRSPNLSEGQLIKTKLFRCLEPKWFTNINAWWKQSSIAVFFIGWWKNLVPPIFPHFTALIKTVWVCCLETGVWLSQQHRPVCKQLKRKYHGKHHVSPTPKQLTALLAVPSLFNQRVYVTCVCVCADHAWPECL